MDRKELDINTNTRWSYSRLSTFQHCKYEFYLNYIVHNDEQYLKESNFYAETGIFVHDILAKIFSGNLSLDDASSYFVENFDDNVFYHVKESTMHKTFVTCADYFAELNLDWLKNYEILGVELYSNFEIDGYPFIGFIDLLLRDKRDGRIVILDHKSSEYPFKQNGAVKAHSIEQFDSYKKQLYLYSDAVYQQYGEYPKELQWNHFKDNGKIATIPFNQKEYDNAIKWATSTIKDAENESQYQPNYSYFYCNRICGFRNSCEYCQLERSQE